MPGLFFTGMNVIVVLPVHALLPVIETPPPLTVPRATLPILLVPTAQTGRVVRLD